ncbi:kinesin-4-like protein [Trifolium pratense]|uniref:Kinesin-4-like protein n=1 Tax=Trifolium pratense TaxID=57577 RepID=A0A2K3P4H7_TRIPR|nr:kinesin-4-like protein [Trifolium pratense]
MATKPLSILSVVEDVIQKNRSQFDDIDFASNIRKSEEASSRRNEAAMWLQNIVGGKELLDEPSEEAFRIALRSGIILCNALNKVQPGKEAGNPEFDHEVVEAPSDIDNIPDGAALSVYQYFENVRNFLVTMEEMGLPTFDASDLEQGGKSSRIVNCVLALKSYSEWKLEGKNGLWKYGGSPKPQPTIAKIFVRKNSIPFMKSLSRGTASLGDKDGSPSEHSSSIETVLNDAVLNDGSEEGSIPSLYSLVREILHDKKQEEIPFIVESLLNKVMEEFESRAITVQQETMEEIEDVEIKQKQNDDVKYHDDEKSSMQNIIQRQHENIQELKMIVNQTKAGMHCLREKYKEDFICLGSHLYSLSTSASRYQKVLEENRKLYNQMQDLKGNIRVYCRVRPLIGQQNSCGVVGSVEEESISLVTSSKNGKEVKKTFTFNKVFGPSATQGEVFSDTQPLIRSVLDGFNVCIFAYGQTGSGKTHTMSGPDNITEETVGVNYRALRDLFCLLEQRKDTIHYDISVQMLEIYNEQNRAVGSTAMNDRSSRSHSCLTVHVQGRELSSGNGLRGCIHLVDLAGSERVDKSEVTGDRLKEAQHINKSLSALGDVISALAQKQSHVPYRNSKLTQLLQDSLGGQAKTLMFVHISPEPEALGETISTLKFAERVSTIELGAARANKESGEVKELKEQIASLKATIARMKDGELEHFKQPSNRITRGRKLPRDDCSSIEDPKKDSSKLKSRSLDIGDIYWNSPPWPDPHGGVNGNEDDKESISCGSMYRDDSLTTDDSFSVQGDTESKQSSSPLWMATTASTNDSDEFEFATSVCSEPDMNWQSHSPKATAVSSLSVSRPKRSVHVRQGKNLETRY